MTTPRARSILDALIRGNRTLVTSVPDKGFSNLFDALRHDDRFMFIPCTREEEAVGICAGAAFAGRRAVLLSQSSGVGNAINALRSLISFYELPLLLLISLRGGPGEHIEAQLPMGRALPALLAACEVRTLSNLDFDSLLNALSEHWDEQTALVATPDEWLRLSA